MKYSRRAVAKIVGIVAATALCCVAGLAWHAAGQLLAPLPTSIGPPPPDFPAKPVSFLSDSGAQVAGWYQAGETGGGAVVLLHGIRSNRTSSLHRARLLAEEGFSTLLIDLSAHGESTGELIGLGHLERHDVRAAVSFVKQQNPGEPIGVVGFSLGGAAAVLAAPLEVDALVLEAVYPTIEDAVGNRTKRFGMLAPVASWALLAQLQPRTGIDRSDLRPIKKVAQVQCPVMIVGGGRDQHTTPDDTRLLFAAAAEPKELVWFEQCGHCNYARWEPERYRDTVVEFLVRHMNAGKGNRPDHKKTAR